MQLFDESKIQILSKIKNEMFEHKLLKQFAKDH